MKKNRTVVSICFLLLIAGCFMKIINYPKLEKGMDSDNYFGVKIFDPYREFENPDSPVTKRWVENQNQITADFIKSSPLHQKIENKLKIYKNIGKSEKFLLNYKIIEEKIIIEINSFIESKKIYTKEELMQIIKEISNILKESNKHIIIFKPKYIFISKDKNKFHFNILDIDIINIIKINLN